MRLTEFLIYINLEKHPLPEQIDFYFPDIRVSDDLKKIRSDYRRKAFPKKKKQTGLLELGQ